MASTDRLQFPFDLHDKLVRLFDLSVLRDLVLDLSFPQYVVPADALRGRARPRALSVCVGFAAFRPDRAVLHRGSVPIDADVMHATGYIIRTPLAERFAAEWNGDPKVARLGPTTPSLAAVFRRKRSCG